MRKSFFSPLVVFCIAGLFFLPFLWPLHTPPISSFYKELIAAILLLFACIFCIFLSPKGDHAKSLPVIALLFVALIFIIAIQLNMGMLSYSYNGLFPLLILMLAVAAVILGSVSVKMMDLKNLLFWISVATIFGGVFNFCSQIIQLYGVEEIFSPWITNKLSAKTNFFYGNLAQTNHLATYFCWSLVCTLYLYARRSIGVISVILLINTFLVGLTLTGSRMSWLLIIWIASASFYSVWRMQPASRSRYWYLVLGLPLYYLMVTLAMPYIGKLAHFSFSFSALDRVQAETLDVGRKTLYSQAWEIFLKNPVLGIGPGEFGFNQFMLMDHYQKWLLASSSHNLILDLLAMTGVLGASVFVIMLSMWLLRVRKIQITFETATIMLMLSVLGVHSLLEYPEWYGFFLWPAAFFFGCLETKFIEVKHSALLRITSIIAVVGGLILSVVLYFEYLQIETLYFNFNKNTQIKEKNNESNAINILSVYKSTFFRAPIEFLLCVNLPINNIDLDKKIEISRRVIHYNLEPNVIYRHMVWLAMANRQDEAASYLVKLSRAYPKQFLDVAKGLIQLSQDKPQMFGKLAIEANKLNSEKK